MWFDLNIAHTARAKIPTPPIITKNHIDDHYLSSGFLSQFAAIVIITVKMIDNMKRPIPWLVRLHFQHFYFL